MACIQKLRDLVAWKQNLNQIIKVLLNYKNIEYQKVPMGDLGAYNIILNLIKI